MGVECAPDPGLDCCQGDERPAVPADPVLGKLLTPVAVLPAAPPTGDATALASPPVARASAARLASCAPLYTLLSALLL